MNSLELTTLPRVDEDAIYQVQRQRLDIPAGAEEMYINDTLHLMGRENPYMSRGLKSAIWPLQSKTGILRDGLMYRALDMYNWLYMQAETDGKESGAYLLLPTVQPNVFDGVVLSSQTRASFNTETLAITKQDNELIAQKIGDETALGAVMSKAAASAYVTAPLIVYRALHNQAQISALDTQFATSPSAQS